MVEFPEKVTVVLFNGGVFHPPFNGCAGTHWHPQTLIPNGLVTSTRPQEDTHSVLLLLFSC